MGCVNSKRVAVLDTPVITSPEPHQPAGNPRNNNSVKSPSGCLDLKLLSSNNNNNNNNNVEEKKDQRSKELKKLKKGSNGGRSLSFSIKLGFSNRFSEAEHIAAGWPTWLSSVAAEAVHGWLPLRAEAYEKLEKIGQGTYSYVYRAREVETGRMMALKKVRFDNFQPESIRFMAREIMILRRLDHPNVMKLEGVITSRSSTSIYLVFEYMEHDLAGLSSSPDIEFTESQVKCFMKQILSGLEHCHLRGIMHRDIKASNILVNDQGILKIADFGLGNILTQKNKHHLTSHVVTLWYRPPELLMGSTSYGVSVDLWSVGCVFAELLLGKPMLKGRTEVEQLHKIFKLCGSPPEEYWRKYKPPYAAIFKPQHIYETSLRERFREYPTNAVNLIETLLSVDPDKRLTASSALFSEYFTAKPLACDPSSLPKYPPNKEIDAKHREELRRKKAGLRMRVSGAPKKSRKVRKSSEEPNDSSTLVPREDIIHNDTNKSNRNDAHGREGRSTKEESNPSFDTTLEASKAATLSQGDSVLSAPANVTASAGFVKPKKQKDVAASTLSLNDKSQISGVESSSLLFANNIFHPAKENNAAKHSMENEIDLSAFEGLKNIHHSFGGSMDKSIEEPICTVNNLGYDHSEKIEFSGPLLLQSHKMDEHLQKNETHIRRAARRTRDAMTLEIGRSWTQGRALRFLGEA
ncbi:hypothetical protein ACFE04_006877 [Oxalis oulophora]